MSRSEFWHPGFSTQTLLDNITVSHIIESMAVVLSRAGAHGDMMLDHFSATQLNSVVKRSIYSNRAVIVIYSNIAFSTDCSHCSHWSKSFTFMHINFLYISLLFKSSNESTAWYCIELIDHAYHMH